MIVRNASSVIRRLSLLALAAVLPVLSCKETPVVVPVATTVQVSPSSATLIALGTTTQFAAVVLDQNGQTMATEPIIWAVGAPSVASVDANGLATAIGVGVTTVTATAGSVSQTAALSVEQRVASVAVTPTAETVEEGETVQLVATAMDANNRPVASPMFSWTSSRPTVATVGPTGLVQARSGGTSIISATSGGVTASATVTVEESGITSLTVTPASSTLQVGDTVRLSAVAATATGRWCRASPQPGPPVRPRWPP